MIYIMYIECLHYIQYNCRCCALKKKALNANVSPTFSPPSDLKLPRESHWTPWGQVQLRSGAKTHLITGNVARKHQSALWQC